MYIKRKSTIHSEICWAMFSSQALDLYLLLMKKTHSPFHIFLSPMDKRCSIYLIQLVDLPTAAVLPFLWPTRYSSSEML